MDRKLTKDELVLLVNKICDPSLSDGKVSEYIGVLERNVPHPSPSDLIFWNDKELTAEEVVEVALSYKVEKGFNAAKQSPRENIMINSKILRDAGIPSDIVDDITNRALNHMKNTLK